MKIKINKLLSAILSVVILVSTFPLTVFTGTAEGPTGQYADVSTMNDWTKLFGPDHLSTDNVGKVWTDKSVFLNNPFSDLGVKKYGTTDSFLVALSAISANTSIVGLSNVPTDTIIILDLSGSMSDDQNGLADEMVEAANESIATLFETNKYNRVGVVLYSGNSDNDAVVLLPLNRYTTASDKQYLSYTKKN